MRYKIKPKPQQREIIDINTMNVISNAVMHYYDVVFEDLEGSSRESIYTDPRHIAMALCYTFTPNSQSMVGKYFGGKDHATVNHAVKKVATLSGVDKSYKDVVCKIIAYVNFELDKSFRLQDVIDKFKGLKTKLSFTDNLIEDFNRLTKSLMKAEDENEMLKIVSKMKEVNDLIREREVKNEGRIGINVK
jgi:hypothetical protein